MCYGLKPIHKLSAKLTIKKGSYTDPVQFEPLVPQEDVEGLRGRAAAIAEASLRLSGRVHPSTRGRLRELLRAMNSYYSNRIEGQSTHPLNIERALKRDFSAKPETARLQRIAVAHIDAEREIEERVEQGRANPLTAAFAVDAHRAMYGRLSPADRTSADGVVVQPGEIRTRAVRVGEHVPPEPGAIPRFLGRYEEVYSPRRSYDERLVRIACAHQRLAWVHPFVDGNGRAARLVTHAAIYPLTGGLWSVSRGLARGRDAYYARLADADEPRRGDLDGRGNLSEEGLRRWCGFFFDVCEDQSAFMSRLLDLDGMKERIAALIAFRATADRRVRAEAVLPLYHLFASGPATRAEFRQLTGLGERTAQSLLSRLLATGLVESDTPLGPVRFGLPLDALQFLFPDLYPEAATRPDA
jgi:Fic family protein